MRIRRRTFRLLGTASSTPAAPPPVLLALPSIPEPCPTTLTSHDLGGFLSPTTTLEGSCQLSRSPWDLLDDISLSNPQEVDDLLDSYSYYVNVDSHANHLFSANMPITSMKNKETMTMVTTSSNGAQLQRPKKKTTLKKATMKENKEGQTQKNAKVKKEEGEEGAARTWKCKKNDGKGWKCPHNASRPNSLCEYHLMKKRSYLNLEFASPMEEDNVIVVAPTTVSKPSSSSNLQNKKVANNYDATEGFYYYNGFGPSHGKRRRNHPKKEEKVEVEPSKYVSPSNYAKVEIEDGTNNGATIGGDDACNNNNSGHNNVNMEKNKSAWKLPRKRVRVRALMSL